MCRNIKTLFNFSPPVTDEEVRAAALQFVRKITGFNQPSKANEASFLAAIDEIVGISTHLLRSLETNAPPRDRAEEAAILRQSAARKYLLAGFDSWISTYMGIFDLAFGWRSGLPLPNRLILSSGFSR